MLSLVEASMLPSHYYVPAIIEGVFLLRNSIPKGDALVRIAGLDSLSRHKWLGNGIRYISGREYLAWTITMK